MSFTTSMDLVSIASARLVQSDRSSVHDGKTERANPGYISVIFDAELEGIGCCMQTQLICCNCCAIWDRERSYLFIRENSIESNVSYKPCCGCCCKGNDYVTVNYFDQPPYEPGCGCCPFPCCCCCERYEPKLEVVDHGCMCCCMKCPAGLCCACCCHQRSVVIMPFDKYCGCCTNRVNWCNNCCGLCGDVTGNPQIFGGFEPQPKDPIMFVANAQSVMNHLAVIPPPGQQAMVQPPQEQPAPVPQHCQDQCEKV